MILLTLTTSTDRGGFALFKDGKLIVQKFWMRKSSNSETIIPALQKVLKSKKLSINKIEGVLLDVGPGSFTGCRISACVAKTLGQSLNIPVFTTTSLDVLIFQNRKKSHQDIWAFLDAHKSLLYALHFNGKITEKIVLLDLNAIETNVSPKALVAGIYPSEIKSVLKRLKSKKPTQNTLNFPLPQTLGKMFFDQDPSIKKMDWNEVEPLYIRVPQVLEKSL